MKRCYHCCNSLETGDAQRLDGIKAMAELVRCLDLPLEENETEDVKSSIAELQDLLGFRAV